MKTKFIMGVLAVVLIMALAFLALPGMTPLAAIGTNGEVATTAAIDLPAATPQSGAWFITDGTPAPATSPMLLLVILGASLVAIAVVLRRGLHSVTNYIASPCSRFNSLPESTWKDRRPRNCILPAAA